MRLTVYILWIPAIIAAGGCPVDDGGGAESRDIDGHWKAFTTESGSSEVEAAIVCVESTGDVVRGMFGGVPFIGGTTAGGVELSYDTTSGWVDVQVDWTSGDELAGQYTAYQMLGAPPSATVVASGTARLVRHVTTGSLTAGTEFDTATDAWGEVEGSASGADFGRVWLTNSAAGSASIVLEFSPGDVLDVDLLSVTSDIVFTRTVISGGSTSVSVADYGDVTITRYDATGIAGTYDVGFNAGAESLAGAFDVPWDVVRGAVF